MTRIGQVFLDVDGIIAECRSDDEWRKRITARLLEAREVILLDNVVRPLDSGVMSAALTASCWEDRILGRSEMIRVSVRCIWVATANNPVLSTEIARRSIRIRLDPKIDRPWLRDGFRHENLRRWADAHRGELIWAALTLGKAWISSGRPSGNKSLGSYEDWSVVMGGVLHVAGITGFLENLTDFYDAADREGAAWRQLVEAWWAQYQDSAVGVADLFNLATELEGFHFGRGNERSQRTSFGMKLRKQRDRVIGEFRIECAGERKRLARWRLGKAGVPGCTFPNHNGRSDGVPYVPGDTFLPILHTRDRDSSICMGGENVHKGTQGTPPRCRWCDEPVNNGCVKVGRDKMHPRCFSEFTEAARA